MNADSGKPEKVFTITPELVFTINQNRCSRCARISVHVRPEYAINRAAVILRYKEPAVAWINEADPHSDPSEITIDSVNDDRTVYLIRDRDADTPADLEEWIKLNYGILFESELDGWYSDEDLWPNNRSINLFRKWFDVECHTVIVDTVDSPIEDDET